MPTSTSAERRIGAVVKLSEPLNRAVRMYGLQHGLSKSEAIESIVAERFSDVAGL